MRQSWIVVLGATVDLAIAELSALFPTTDILKLSGPCVLLKDVDIDPLWIRDTAGGVVKIARIVTSLSSVTPKALANILLESHKDQKSIVFGVSRYDGQATDTHLLADIKEELVSRGMHVRFVKAKEQELSSVVVEKQSIQELIIAGRDGETLVGETVAVQDFESWGKRDYGRPNADPKLGMLPPKVARIAVNIAIGTHSNQTILDPFCGMGTIVAEGLLRGCTLFGSDISKEVVDKAKQNIEWLAKEYRSADGARSSFLVSDATHISEKLPPDSVDAVVTEPFMGTAVLGEKRITDPEKIRGIVKGLEKLYIGALKDWVSVVKRGGKVVISLPEFSINRRVYFVKKVVDSCENLGYTTIVGPIEYSRPQAVVKRKFFVFKKK